MRRNSIIGAAMHIFSTTKTHWAASTTFIFSVFALPSPRVNVSYVSLERNEDKAMNVLRAEFSALWGYVHMQVSSSSYLYPLL